MKFGCLFDKERDVCTKVFDRDNLASIMQGNGGLIEVCSLEATFPLVLQ